MFAVICSMIYGFWEKRVQKKYLVDILYFLSVTAVWTVVICISGLIMALGKPVNPQFIRLLPLIGAVLGLIFAFFPWIFGLRNSFKK